VALMRSYFHANLNFQGSGAVIASPDADVGPGGSYRFHWSRDGALSMRTYMNSYISGAVDWAAFSTNMFSYVKYVLIAHNQTDPFGQDILTEPKFLIPDGKVYPGGWCRPQNDGPALRATTLIQFANILIKMGNTDFVSQYLWTNNTSVYGGGIIRRDLDYTQGGGAYTNTCDLWEEVQNSDFFWNRLSHSRAMYLGSQFAQSMGNPDLSKAYLATYNSMSTGIMAHWNGNFLYESTNRPLDGAVIAALNEALDDQMPTPFNPTSQYASGTIAATINAFCMAYPINNIDTKNGVNGVLIGRYPNDGYFGGNPWILLTAYLAQSFYRGSLYSLTTNSLPPSVSMDNWRYIFPTLPNDANLSVKSFASVLLSAGDGVMQRIAHHTAGNNFHLNEQIDKNQGTQISAYDLTWSYAVVLRTLEFRKTVSDTIKQYEATI